MKKKLVIYLDEYVAAYAPGYKHTQLILQTSLF